MTAGRTEQLRNGTSVRYGVSGDMFTEHIAQLMISRILYPCICILRFISTFWIYQHFLKIAVVEGVSS